MKIKKLLYGKMQSRLEDEISILLDSAYHVSKEKKYGSYEDFCQLVFDLYRSYTFERNN